MNTPDFRKILELTGCSGLIMDFVEDALPDSRLLPQFPGIEEVRRRIHERGPTRQISARILRLIERQSVAFQSGERVRNNVRRLENPDTMVVAVPLRPVLFGGPLSTLLKCLTAVKLASSLNNGISSAVPVCWIDDPEARDAKEPVYVNLLDSESNLRRLSLERLPTVVSPEPDLPVDQVNALIDRIAELDPGAQSDEILGPLRQTYAAGTSLAEATGRYITRLFDPWGLVVIDGSSQEFHAVEDDAYAAFGASFDGADSAMLEQHNLLVESGYSSLPAPVSRERQTLEPLRRELLLPVAAHVLDSTDLPLYSIVFPLFRAIGMNEPVIWPHSGATVIDTRSRKTMEKYELEFEDLLAGGKADTIVESYRDIFVHGTGILDEMMSGLDTRMIQVGGRIPSEQGLRADLEGTQERIAYQLEKLRMKFITGAKMRAETAARQVERVRSSLLPMGRLQQDELGGLHFILRYSAAILEVLHSRLDIADFRHQLISVE